MARLDDLLYRDTAENATARYKGLLERRRLFKNSDLIITGTATGIDGLDRVTLGLQDTDLWIVQGRTGVGKTYFLCYIAHHMREQGKRVLLVNREMEPQHVMARVDALAARFSYTQWRRGKLDDDAITRYGAYIASLAKSSGKIDVVKPIPYLTPKILGQAIERHKPDVVMVDYLNRMEANRLDAGSPRLDSLQTMRQIADALKDFAYRDHVPIIAAAQTNRAAMQKGGRGEAPGTEHLFGGDVLGWNADLVLSLYRTNEMYIARQMGLSMVKYRHGEEINMLLKWDLEEGIIQYEASVSRGESIKDAMKREHESGIPEFQD